MIRTLLSLLVAWPVLASAQISGDVRDIRVTVTLTAEPAMCSFSVVRPLNFGMVLQPRAPGATGEVEWNSSTGALRTNDQIATPTGAEIGAFSVLVQSDRAGTTVSIDLPTILSNGNDALPFAGEWSESDNKGEFRPIAGNTFEIQRTGDFQHHFQYGGILGGITADRLPGGYQGNGLVQVSCI